MVGSAPGDCDGSGAPGRGGVPALGRLAGPLAGGLCAATLALCLAGAPLLGFLDRNRDEIAAPGRIVTWAVVAGAAAAGLAVVAWAATCALGARARPEPFGAALGVAGFLTFQWSWFAHGPVAARYVLWAGVTAAAVLLAARAARSPSGRAFLLAVAVAYAAIPAGSYGWWRAHDYEPPPESPPPPPPPPPVREGLPDVYVFVLDGYARADQLATVVGADSAGFETALRARGFTVDAAAHAAYPVTWLSIASLLEAEHVATTPADVVGGRTAYLPALRGDHATARALRRLGYATVHAESGTYDGTRCGQWADACIPAAADSHGLALDEVEYAAARLTPLRPLLDAGVLPLGDTYTEPVRVVEAAAGLRPGLGDHPLFVFAHVVSPHAPYRFGAGCSHRRTSVAGLGSGWDRDLRDDYAGQLACLQQQLLDAVDVVVARDPDAIVVLTGDHGTAFTVDFEAPLARWTPEQLAERFAVFRAVRLPERCRSDDPRAASLVNTLRLVVACVEGHRPQLVDPRAFLYRYGQDTLEELPDLAVLAPAPDSSA